MKDVPADDLIALLAPALAAAFPIYHFTAVNNFIRVVYRGRYFANVSCIEPPRLSVTIPSSLRESDVFCVFTKHCELDLRAPTFWDELVAALQTLSRLSRALVLPADRPHLGEGA